MSDDVLYGIDTPRRDELIAARHSVEEIRSFIGADSLGYLSLDGMLRALEGDEASFCTACWTGNHPVPLPPGEATQLPLFEKTHR